VVKGSQQGRPEQKPVAAPAGGNNLPHPPAGSMRADQETHLSQDTAVDLLELQQDQATSSTTFERWGKQRPRPQDNPPRQEAWSRGCSSAHGTGERRPPPLEPESRAPISPGTSANLHAGDVQMGAGAAVGPPLICRRWAGTQAGLFLRRGTPRVYSTLRPSQPLGQLISL
jgi:hypothetical protein